MEHRAYQPLLPAGNKYLQQKWDNASYDLHRKKVQSNTSLWCLIVLFLQTLNLSFYFSYKLRTLLIVCVCMFVCVLKVMSAKPTIKTTPPQTYGHLALKLKKQKVAVHVLSSSHFMSIRWQQRFLSSSEASN